MFRNLSDECISVAVQRLAEADIADPMDLGFLKQDDVASLLHTDDHPDVKR